MLRPGGTAILAFSPQRFRVAAMTRSLPLLRALAAAGLLLAGASAFATPPEEDPIAAVRAAYVRAVPPGEQADLYAELFGALLQRVQGSYATEVDLAALSAAARASLDKLPAGSGEPAEAFKAAMNAALRTLDPHSRYLDARTHSHERSALGGSWVGVGLEVESGTGGVRVVTPTPGGPAARSGVQSGDVIVRVDDLPLAGVPLADAIGRMRGQPGTTVALTLRRTGTEQEITLSLTRETIRRQALRWHMEGDVLVLRLATFTGPVAAALQQAVNDAVAVHAPRAVVLDLRGNPGGLLREAVNVADTFLAQGDIVSLRGRTPSNQRAWQADATELLPGAPMVVLVDGRSASASELVAAALQENGRAVVMGVRSFGKGSVQSTYALGGQKGALKLTTSFYHGPSGRSVQKTGVAPDIELAAGAREDAAGSALRVDPGRCPALPEGGDAMLSCALAFLQAGSREAFAAGVASPAH